MTGRRARRPRQNPRQRGPTFAWRPADAPISCGTTCEASESFFKDHGCVVSRLAATCFRSSGFGSKITHGDARTRRTRRRFGRG